MITGDSGVIYYCNKVTIECNKKLLQEVMKLCGHTSLQGANELTLSRKYFINLQPSLALEAFHNFAV